MSGTRDPLRGVELDGRFRLEERIGAGGMGAVYRARQLNIDRDVAVKLLHPLAAEDPEYVRRFENEARIIAQLRDPHTLKLIDFGRMADGQLYIVMEYLAGRSLKQVLEDEGQLSAKVTLGYVRQLCDALAEAHAAGIVHRDLKPGNLFVERVGHRDVVKVLDFGIARWSRPGGDATTGPIHGTPEYMSPEQARGERVDGRSDLYSLGVLAYECIAGGPVFESETAMGLLLKHLQDPPTPFDAREPPVEVEERVEALVMRLLEKDPAHRPADALELAAEIEDLLAGRPSAEVALSFEETVDAATPRPRRWPLLVGFLVAVALAAVLWPRTPEVPVRAVGVPTPLDAGANVNAVNIGPDGRDAAEVDGVDIEAGGRPSGNVDGVNIGVDGRPAGNVDSVNIDAGGRPAGNVNAVNIDPDAGRDAARKKRVWKPRPKPKPEPKLEPDAARPPPRPKPRVDAARPPGPFIRVVPKPK